MLGIRVWPAELIRVGHQRVTAHTMCLAGLKRSNGGHAFSCVALHVLHFTVCCARRAVCERAVDSSPTEHSALRIATAPHKCFVDTFR
jgi:hypothetical protein